VMLLAKDRDMIARQYVTDFKLVRNLAVSRFPAKPEKLIENAERIIVEWQLHLLLVYGDDLIRRKLGNNGGYSMETPLGILANLDYEFGREGFRDFDAFLRADNHKRNPGTTADLIAAGLFVALREKQIALDCPFAWDQHPFDGMT
jgi:triphosphoribosyl-dephospho-CoA synthase